MVRLGEAVRTLARDGRCGTAGDVAVDAKPVEPAEPVVSAKAVGTQAIADPTPRAIASAPTRPTWFAWHENPEDLENPDDIVIPSPAPTYVRAGRPLLSCLMLRVGRAGRALQPDLGDLGPDFGALGPPRLAAHH